MVLHTWLKKENGDQKVSSKDMPVATFETFVLQVLGSHQ